MVPQWLCLELLPGETVQWEGRPAPRCYTFRRWRHALFGLVLTVFCAVWTRLGIQQAAEQDWPWLALVPMPFLGYAIWLAGGQLLAARIEWRQVAYVITTQRVIVQRGLLTTRKDHLALDQVSWFRLQFHAEELGSLRIHNSVGESVLLMHCVEYPRRPAELLEIAIAANQNTRAEQGGGSDTNEGATTGNTNG